MSDNHLTNGAVPGDNIHHALRQTSLATDVSKKKRGQRCIFGRFQDHCVAHRDGWRDFPREHQQGEIPWNDLPTDAQRFAVWQFLIHQLGHTCVVIEVPLRKRYVDVPRLADRFAVVQRFKNGKQPRVFLQKPRDGIDVPRAPCAAELLPFALRRTRRSHRSIDIFLCCLRKRSQHLTRCRVPTFKTFGRFGEVSVDEMTETVALIHQPGQRLCRAFRCRAVIHGLEDLFDCHVFFSLKKRNLARLLSLPGDDTRPSIDRSRGVPVGVRYPPIDWTRQSGTDPVATSGCPARPSSRKDTPEHPWP